VDGESLPLRPAYVAFTEPPLTHIGRYESKTGRPNVSVSGHLTAHGDASDSWLADEYRPAALSPLNTTSERPGMECFVECEGDEVSGA
jgi:hypothetical protein